MSWFIKRAAPQEAGEALAILREVAQWLVDSGRPLWPVESFHLDAVRRAALAGELILGFADAQPVASMLLQTRDDVYWPNDPPGEALYLHKIAVRRCAAGQQWSTRLIAWARERAHDAGAQFLRLDTADRVELLALYRRHGFDVVDDAPRRVGDLLVYRLEHPIGRRA
ncbi:MAG TPA: GNAT family N-acetyltransferase [Verrucomicrobiae bacterium]|nr:GNAT family N-acetyltransferase [Verrucomicrobiae bacterium]